MTNEEILTIASALTADAKVMGYRNIELHYVVAGGGLFQVRVHNGPDGVEVLPFPATLAGLVAARREARDRAELAAL